MGESGRPAAGMDFLHEEDQVVEPGKTGKDKGVSGAPKLPITKSSGPSEIGLEMVKKLRAKVNQLTDTPLSFAIVAAVFKRGELLPKEFTAGNLVTVTRGKDKGATGLILKSVDSDNEILVRLDTNEEVIFNVGDPDQLDLELVGRTTQTAVIIADSKFIEVGLPDDLEILPGDTVKINYSTLQIVEKSPMKFGGEILTVKKVLSSELVQLDWQSAKRVVLSGQFGASLKAGDKVLVDGSVSIVLEKIEVEEQQFVFTLDTNVQWSDIAGNEQAKEELIEAVEVSFQNPELFKVLNKKPPKGVLLWGPPGCGKTMLIKALATTLKKLHGNITGCLIYIKGPEILRGIVGDTETIIRQIFQQAREFEAKYGFPAIIFVDEAEAILPKRGSGISSDVEKTIVPAFLNEMNGLEDSGAIVILATNRPDILDPAAIRDGRIDLKLKIDRPTREAVKQIFFKHLSKIQLEAGVTAETLAVAATKEFFSDKRVLYEISTRTKVDEAGEIQFKDEVKLFTLAQIVNGAMIDGVINKATSLALRRARAEKSTQPYLKQEDVRQGIDLVQQENEKLDVNDALADFCRDFKDDVVGVHQLRQGRS